MSSLLKLPFIAIVAISLYIVGHSPNPPVPMKERVGAKMRETMLSHMIRVKVLFLLLGLVETALVLLENFWPEQIRGGSLYLTPVSTISALTVLAGAIIRLRCYKVLGPLFTFELTIKDNHKLVKHGPYSVVRHPAYSGGYLSALGALMWYFTPGSLLFATTAWASRLFAIFFITLFLLGTYLILSRTNEEDRLLQQRFGKEWEDWARKVPCKLVPYLY